MTKLNYIVGGVIFLSLALLKSEAFAQDTVSVQPVKVTISTAPVGYLNNRANSGGYGSVSHLYWISKFEVTQSQYTIFLNAVARTKDPYHLYDDRMGVMPYGGIRKNILEDGSFTYSVSRTYAAKPINFVSWTCAARFVNWLENGQPSGDPEIGRVRHSKPLFFWGVRTPASCFWSM